MSISKASFARYIKQFEFRELFNDMGWNNDRSNLPIIVNDLAYSLSCMAEKSGFRILTCVPADGAPMPDNSTRKKIENKVAKHFLEHLIIFHDADKSSQIWQLAVRKTGLPTKISETRYLPIQDPELLYQRASGLFFTLDEEDKITIVDVTKRVADNFQKNNEKVTKKFYEGFKKEHASFLKFIEGIDDKMSMDWYASLMLNRLMFCYFIQKKGFLDNNKNYLQEKLKICKEKRGKNKFYSFYRDFLLALFHEGLGAPEHAKNLEIEIGKIPYLNGGLFDEHELEKTYQKIVIDDKAFERLFNFFDEYEWHLDTREAASGKDINPDVIGYIFEKYINDRADMGAYYTKEDITDYISKNCIIPWLFDETKRQYPKAFEAVSWLWKMVKESGDEYIYDAVKYGINAEHDLKDSQDRQDKTDALYSDLPPEVLKGFNPELESKIVDGTGSNLWELRKEWNKPAPPEIGLPTEIYREIIERRNRYAGIKSKIETGEIKEINDFITCNLNIRQFAQDVIETTNDPDLIRHFYKALSSVTILDPTCGSGAFLFAALNILESLYEACIRRMQDFVSIAGKGKYRFFEETLKQVQAPEHPNRQYFIYKSIILNNLYGVDIMNEAVEIAKLRLFLKLVATVEADYRKPNLGLEPLPDVDFNIRAGNTLVGYATKKQIDEIAGMFVTEAQRKKIHEQCDIVSRVFERYKEIQLGGSDDYKEFKKAKDDLNGRLTKLTDDLDNVLYVDQYDGDERISHKDHAEGDSKISQAYKKWLGTHQPFHWFAEFYEIVQGKGGFDVVIGNPPYVEYAKAQNTYTINNEMKTLECGNLYVFVLEKSIAIKSNDGIIGFIVPISLTAAQRMKPIQNLLFRCDAINYLSNFALRPAALFPGVMQRLSIIIHKYSKLAANYTTDYLTWYNDERDILFEAKLNYQNIGQLLLEYSIPKVNCQISLSCMVRLLTHHKYWTNNRFNVGKHQVFYHNAGGYWVKTFNFKPFYKSLTVKDKKHTTISELNFESDKIASVYLLTMNCSTFYFFWKTVTDARHIYPSDIINFPLNYPLNDHLTTELLAIKPSLMQSFIKNSERIVYGNAEVDQFKISPSKIIIDQIDTLLAIHYGFTHAELDFIINYDIKYRMGKELDDDDDSKSVFMSSLAEMMQSKPPYFPESAIKELVTEKQLPITEGTVSQYLLEAVKNGIVFDAGRGWYSSLANPFDLNIKPVKSLISLLSKGFPLLDFSCWSTEQVNPFAQHLMSQFLTFVYVESDSIEPVSEYLRDRGYSVYADPGKSVLNDLFRVVEKTVVVRKAITKQPVGENHAAPIEKILVDLVWEAQKVPFLDESEAHTICDNATGSSRVNFAELLGYAKRRTLEFGWLRAVNQVQNSTKTGLS